MIYSGLADTHYRYHQQSHLTPCSRSRDTSRAVPPRPLVGHYQTTQLLKDTADWLKVRYHALQKHVLTRWWSEVTTIDSVLKNKKALKALLMKDESPCPELLRALDWDMLEVLLEILQPFATVTEAMEADKYSTVGSVLGMVAYLQKKISAVTIHDNPGIVAAARDMQADFDSRCYTGYTAE